MKALELLKTNTGVAERAENYVSSVKRNIQRDVIDALTAKKEKIDDELFELKNFSLETDANKGVIEMKREDVEKRFRKIIDLEYELKLVSLELTAKQESFEKYFG
jgi:archaellum component FlaC